MSGHSKWSTIKRQKGANDKAKGKLFSKMTKAIAISIKSGGGSNPDMNYRLRIAIDAAKAENMPKATIDRAITKASETGDLTEIMYEGFGPFGIQVMVEAATDNRNRTSQEMKTTFDRGGGTLGGPGSVSFNFTPRGFLITKKTGDVDDMMLKLIDLGVEDIEEEAGTLEVYVPASELYSKKQDLEKAGFEIISAELIQKPSMTVEVDNSKSEQVFRLLEMLEDLEDVQNVYTNVEFTDN